MLEALGHPEREYATIHVGGTNGKGSVSTLAYRALREAGFSVGLYTSPHLVDVRERIVVDECPISRRAFAEWTARLRPLIERVEASFFEATTAIAFADFAARGVEVAVIEVGLGGRLDSTNVIMPLASAVTTIALEHTQYLGSSLAGIAREKAGIAKPGVPFVIGESDPEIAAVLRAEAEARGARPIVTVPRGAEYRGPLGLAGCYQRRNAAVARALLGSLPGPFRPDEEAMRRGFEAAHVPGRFDRRGVWLFDVAHNPAGVEVLVAAMAEARVPRPLHTLLAVLADKAWREMVTQLAKVSDRLWLSIPPSAPAERRWVLEEVARCVPPEVIVEPDFGRALEQVRQGAGTALVTGSFHTVGDALARLPGFAPLG